MAKKHEDEIFRWAQQPEGTKVWCKRKGDKHWGLMKTPGWFPDNQYIVDDEYATDRMRIIETEGEK